MRASIRWPRPFYQKLTLRASQIMGALTLKSRFFVLFPGSSCFKYLRNAILLEFFMLNPYRSGSFQLGTEKGSKIEDFSENIVFYVYKLKHLIWVTFRGALSLKQIFSLKTHVK